MSVADLGRAYRISRSTACRWINRYNETVPEGLVDHSTKSILLILFRKVLEGMARYRLVAQYGKEILEVTRHVAATATGDKYGDSCRPLCCR